MGKQQFPCPGWGLPMLGLTPGQELLQSWGGTWDWHCRAHTCARISPACPDVQGDGDSCAPSPWEAQSSARVLGRMGTAQCRGETKGFRDTWQPPAPPMHCCSARAAPMGMGALDPPGAVPRWVLVAGNHPHAPAGSWHLLGKLFSLFLGALLLLRAWANPLARAQWCVAQMLAGGKMP